MEYMGRRQDKTRERLRTLIIRMMDGHVPVSKEVEKMFKQYNYDIEVIVETLMRAAEKERKLMEKREQARIKRIMVDEFMLDE